MAATPEQVWDFLLKLAQTVEKLSEKVDKLSEDREKLLKEILEEREKWLKEKEKLLEEERKKVLDQIKALNKLFEETDKRFKETDKRFKETDKRFKETDKKFKETEKRFRETAKRFEETDKRFKETDKRFKETDKRFKETEKRFRETDKKFRETDKKIKELSNLFTTQWGKLVEALVEPGAVNLFRERGIDVRYTARRIEVEDKKRRKIAEYDIVLVNDKEVVIIEVKTTVKKEDVDYFLEKLAKVREHLRSLVKDKKVYGAVAGISFDEGVDRYAYRSGLFVLKSEGGIIRIANDPDFRPKVW
jgi:hypothetical protein